MDDLRIIELYFNRDEQAIKETDTKYGKLCHSIASVSYTHLKLIRKLNDELKAKGFITIAGRVNRQYFYERLYGAGKEKE